jgi:hypothetical protein
MADESFYHNFICEYGITFAAEVGLGHTDTCSKMLSKISSVLKQFRFSKEFLCLANNPK